MSLKKRIDAITAFEDQLEEAQVVSEELESHEGPELVPAVLAMYERNAEEDDYGVFHAFANYIEEQDADAVVDGATVAEHIAASVGRTPVWKTCELLRMMVPADVGARALMSGLEGKLRPQARECALLTLRELLDEADPPLSDAVATTAAALLA
jgi:hypothetical protein